MAEFYFTAQFRVIGIVHAGSLLYCHGLVDHLNGTNINV